MNDTTLIDEASQESQPSESTIKLHVGGIEPRTGWTIVNIMDGPHVDVLGSATDLAHFSDGSVTEIYASHILEHLSHRVEMLAALREFARVLKAGGLLRASVPDLEVLCRLYTMPGISDDHRFLIMRMIYGGQIDEFDYHKTGFNFSLMAHALKEVGFRSCTKVESHGLFQDTSESVVLGLPISLNIKATR